MWAQNGHTLPGTSRYGATLADTGQGVDQRKRDWLALADTVRHVLGRTHNPGYRDHRDGEPHRATCRRRERAALLCQWLRQALDGTSPWGLSRAEWDATLGRLIDGHAHLPALPELASQEVGAGDAAILHERQRFLSRHPDARGRAQRASSASLRTTNPSACVSA